MRPNTLGQRARCLVFCLLVAVFGVAAPPAVAQAEEGEAAEIRFNFKDATFEQVIDFFSRETGMPVVWETDPPKGTLSYLSERAYGVDDALHVLNVILQAKGVMLRRDEGMLYLQKLSEMQREDIPTFVGTLPASVRDDQIVTIVLPLSIAEAGPLAEKLAALVAEYGSVTALEQQNALVVTETAAQVRRLMGILVELDREDPDGAVEILRVENTRAKDLMQPLEAILSKKVERVVLDKKNKPQRVTVEEMTGLSLSYDDRINAIIAKGVQSRIDKVREMIEILDVPGTGGGRQVRAFRLARLTPREAKAAVDQVFKNVPEAERPVVVPLDAERVVTVVGDQTHVEEAERVLGAIDGMVDAGDAGGSRATITPIALEYVTPDAMIRSLRGLMTERQQALVRLVPGTDGESILVAGAASEIARVAELVAVLDEPTPLRRNVRVVRLDAPDRADLLARARTLYERERGVRGDAGEPAFAIEVELDDHAGAVTMIGTDAALDGFARAIETVRNTVRTPRETRRFAVGNVAPSRLVPELRSLAGPLLDPRDGTPFRAPEFQPIDALDILVVVADPDQMDALASLVTTLDRPSPDDFASRIIPVSPTEDAAALVRRAGELFQLRLRGRDATELPLPDVEHDEASRRLLVHGVAGAVALWEQSFAEARQLTPAATGRLVTLQRASAADVVPVLRDMIARATPAGAPPLRMEVVEVVNGLYIVGTAEQQAIVDRMLPELDRVAPMDSAPLRLLPIRGADPGRIAAMLQKRYDARRPEARRERPVTIDADAKAGVLFVSAPADVMAEIETFVNELNATALRDGARVTLTFRLEQARVSDVAAALEALYPPPPMPVDWRGRPQPQLQPPRELGISADATTNTLIVDVPVEKQPAIETLVAELDQAHAVGDDRVVRLFTVEQADPSAVAEVIRATMSAGGARGAAAGGDAPPSISVEPVSRTLIVTATDAQLATVETLVARFDRPSADRPQVRTVMLSHARAENVAPVVQRLLQSEQVPMWMRVQVARSGQEIESGPDVRVQAEPLLNAVVISAPLAALDIAEEMVRQLDVDPTQNAGRRRDVRLIVLANARASDVATNLAPMFEGEPGGAPAPTIRVDDASNALIVRATAAQFETLQALVERLDDAAIASTRQMRLVPIDPTRASAEDVARTLERMLQRAGGPRVEVVPFEELLRSTRPEDDTEDDAEAPAEAPAAGASSSRATGWIGLALAVLPASPPPPPADAPPPPDFLDWLGAYAAASGAAPDGATPAPVPTPGPGALDAAVVAQARTDPDALREAVAADSDVLIAVDPATNSLVVIGAPRAVERLTAFAEDIQRQLPPEPARVRYVTLPAESDANAVARLVDQTLRLLGREQGGRRSLRDRATVLADRRNNALVVAANDRDFETIAPLIASIGQSRAVAPAKLRIIELSEVPPSRAAQVIQRAVVGTDQTRRARTVLVPDDTSGRLLVRADPEVRAEIDAVLAEIDRDAASDLEVRTIILERADAAAVARSMQRFFDDRARIASAGRGRRTARRVSIIGDATSNALLVAASAEDFVQVTELVERFDSPQASTSLEVRVFPLEHARATDIQTTVDDLMGTLMWNSRQLNRRGQPGRNQGNLAVRADARLNALIVTGDGERFAVVERIVEVLDAPPDEGAERVVRLYRPEQAELDLVVEVLRELFTDVSRAQRWWEPADPNEVKIRRDDRSRTLIVSATEEEHEEIGKVVVQIDGDVAAPERKTTVLPLEYADARDIERTMGRFLDEQARLAGRGPRRSAVIASRSANALVVSATTEELALIRDLLTSLDQSDVTGDRVVEILSLEVGEAEAVARIVREQFGRRGGQGVIVTADARTNSLIVNAPRRQFAQAQALIERLDAPSAADETIIRTYALESARADDAQRILSQTLQLDARGEARGVTIKLDEDAEAVEVNARIVADRRSNSLVVTATAASLPVIEALVRQLDDVPTASPIEYRIIPLEHALADDVSWTLRQVGRWNEGGESPPTFDHNRTENQLIVGATAAQFEQIATVIAELDRPSTRQRTTDFVPLEFAEAAKIQEALAVFYGPYAVEADTPGKRNVSIVADPATNSLVISADEAEWEDIRSLLAELDSQEYDASLQLTVLPLLHADAASVARAINDAFQGRVERDRAQRAPERRGGTGGDDERREATPPTVLVGAEEWVRASADEQTNAVIVSASRQNIRKIEQIITQLDVADYAKLPAPRLIPIAAGDPERVAASLRQLYTQREGARGRAALRIVGDPGSSTVIVRAADEDFVQIAALAEAIQQKTTESGLAVHVVALESAPARRVADAIDAAYQTRAEAASQPLSIRVDATANALVIASTPDLYEEIRATIDQLDDLAPGRGQRIMIIELEHVAPETVRDVIETIGLDEPPSDDSVSRVVAEPVRVTVLRGRRAVAVVTSPGDRETVLGLIRAIDAEPALATAQMRVVKLTRARADAVARLLGEVVSPVEQQARTPLAIAVQEQVRRLSLRREGLDEPDLDLDLGVPIRVVPDVGLNAIVISSTPENVETLVEMARLFDELPITAGATVQLFPLEHIAAEEFVRIVRELFDQGKRIGRVPGTDRSGVPGGLVGAALLDEIALSVDTRTNTVIAAGKEDAVALVEVLGQRLDEGVSPGWVEARFINLVHADAETLAQTLQAILVEGGRDLPQATPLQRQIGRLRLAQIRPEDGRGVLVESEVFQPMSRLVIRAERQLNAIVLVGAVPNLEIVGELIDMLDVEAASPDATVRIYPVENAAAARLAGLLTGLFDEQVRSKAIRPEDRVIVEADDRTNSLVVTTSPRSFAVLDSLLTSLDVEIAPDLRAIHPVRLEHASATRVATLVQTLMDARLDRLRSVRPETAELERTAVVPDERTNSLFIAANTESLDVIRRLVEDLDRAPRDGQSLVQVIPIEQGSVERLAEAIDAVMDRRYADRPDEIAAAERPLVITDVRSNSLLVAANPADLEAIRGFVAQLASVPANPAVGLHVVAVPIGASAEALAPKIQRLMRERVQSLGDSRQPADNVTIEADAPANTLIVAASAENAGVVRELVALLAQADGGEGGDIEIIPLKRARADDVENVVAGLYADEERAQSGPGAVQVTVDERLNALVVKAPPADVERIRSIVAQLDGTSPATVVEVKYVALQSANAIETVGLIENVLSGRGIGAPRNSRRATVIKYLRELAEGEVADDAIEVSAAVRESIVLTPDVRTNTIIVSAPRESMDMLERMIRDLDQSTTGAKNIRVFKLENADATAMAEILVDLFNLRQGSNLLVLKPREGLDAGGVEGTGGLGGTELTAVPDERQQLSITVDSRTNSLLVSGSPTYLALVEDVVVELDAVEANEREVFIYRLRNALAADVARVVGDFVAQEQEKLVSTLSTDQIGSAARLLEREVTIQGDDQSNTVLVSASPRYMSRVQRMIEEIDIDPPQVLIQVMLAEISLESTDDWGFDMALRTDVGNGSLTGGFGFGSSFVTGPGIPTLTLAFTDFEIMVRALQEKKRLAVLSNPMIMTATNETATLQVGETIRVPETTSFTEAGTSNTSLIEENVGVLLSVTPTINPDGYVRIEVVPEISALSEETTQINEDLSSPIITRRELSTTVTVHSGQTVVLGGLVAERIESIDRKVPFLGDIPLLGVLFRSKNEKTERVELVIVLTPHVIQSPTDKERVEFLTTSEIDRLTLPDRLKQRIREGKFDSGGGLFDAKGNPIEINLDDRFDGEETPDDAPPPAGAIDETGPADPNGAASGAHDDAPVTDDAGESEEGSR